MPTANAEKSPKNSAADLQSVPIYLPWHKNGQTDGYAPTTSASLASQINPPLARICNPCLVVGCGVLVAALDYCCGFAIHPTMFDLFVGTAPRGRPKIMLTANAGKALKILARICKPCRKVFWYGLHNSS